MSELALKRILDLQAEYDKQAKKSMPDLTSRLDEHRPNVESVVNYKMLDLSNCGLSFLPEQLFELRWIISLDLSNNPIDTINGIEKLKYLRDLDLGFTLINNIKPLAILNSLRRLNLSDSPVSDIRPLFSMIGRGAKVVLNNPWQDNDEANNASSYISVDRRYLQYPPASILNLGSSAISHYIQDLNTQGTEILSEAKLIIVGEPGAGKTTLMNKILNPDYEIPQPEDSTLGIQVYEGWRFYHAGQPEKDFYVNIWDFGGQQIQYMTHQFFLTPGAVYLLVSANDRKETMANFPYWFKIIHLLGHDENGYSPVLVIQNDMNDKFVQDFDHSFYSKHYPELQIDHCHINLRKDTHSFLGLRENIKKMLHNLPHVNNERPAGWKPIRATLGNYAKSHNHIDFETYAEICNNHKVKNEDSQLLFSRYLHCLGSILHFTDDPQLKDFIILNPQWAVDAVYIILSNTKIQRNAGKFTYDDIESLWKDSYSIEERSKLLALMSKDNFEICYELANEKGIYIAPQLLTDSRLCYPKREREYLKFRFQYTFMPEGIITRLIVRLHDKIAKRDGQDVAWRKGILLDYEDCEALVFEEESREGLKVIDINITGNINEHKYLLRIIRDEIHSIHRKWFVNIQMEEMIPCNCSSCADPENNTPYYHPFSVLKKFRDKGRHEITCNASVIDVDVMSLLEGIYFKKELLAHDGIRYSEKLIERVQETPKSANEIHVHNHLLAQAELPEPEKISEEVHTTAINKHKWTLLTSIILLLLFGTWSGYEYLTDSTLIPFEPLIGVVGSLIAMAGTLLFTIRLEQ